MTTRDFAHLIRRVGSVLAVATAIAVVGGVVQVIAAPPAPKAQMCHVVGNGRSHMISISGNAESAHRAHGDARPGEPVPGDASLQFDAECKQVPLRLAPSQMACPCWSNYTEPQLLNLLAAVAGDPWCIKTESMVSLSPDQGATELVYANAGVCILRLNGQDVASIFSLTPAETNHCMAEAAAFIPSIKWCPQ